MYHTLHQLNTKSHVRTYHGIVCHIATPRPRGNGLGEVCMLLTYHVLCTYIYVGRILGYVGTYCSWLVAKLIEVS